MPERGLDAIEATLTRHDTVVDGRRLAWRRIGQGPAVLLLHGGHGSWAHWARNLPALAARHTLWLPDLPCYGDSDDLGLAADDPHTVDHLVGALARGWAALPAAQEPVHLAGFSFGGLVAARWAAAWPMSGAAPLASLSLLGTAGHGGPRQRTVTMQGWRRLPHEAQDAVLLANLGALMLHHPVTVDDLAFQIYARQLRASHLDSRRLSERGGLAESLSRLTLPVTLIWGEHDVTAEVQVVGAALRAACPQAALGVVADAGHWVQFEAADAVNHLLLEAFASAPQPSTGSV